MQVLHERADVAVKHVKDEVALLGVIVPRPVDANTFPGTSDERHCPEGVLARVRKEPIAPKPHALVQQSMARSTSDTDLVTLAHEGIRHLASDQHERVDRRRDRPCVCVEVTTPRDRVQRQAPARVRFEDAEDE